MTTTLTNKKGISKSRIICNKIKADISSGKYVKQLPGVTLMAKELGVNPLTVNKAFAMLEKQGFVERVSRKGTFIKSKNRIGLVIYRSGSPETPSNQHGIPPVFAGVMEGVHESISSHSYTMLTHTLYESDKKEIEQIINEVDGLIIVAANPKPTDFSCFQKIPWVKVMGTLDNPPDANHVTYDNDEIGVMAAEYLMKHNCKKFYYFGGKDKLFAPRYENFNKTLEKHKHKGELIGLDYAQLTLDVLAPLAKARFEEIFYGNHQRIGFFLSSTSYLNLTYQLLYSLGIIPMTDVEIVTCENMRPTIDGIIPRPTVIDLRMKEIGKRSAEMLIRLLQTPHENNVYEKITLAPKLIESSYNRSHNKS